MNFTKCSLKLHEYLMPNPLNKLDPPRIAIGEEIEMNNIANSQTNQISN